MQDADEAVGELAEAGVAAPAWIRATVLLNVGAAQFGVGRAESAATTLANGVAVARNAGCDPELAACLGQLALVEAVRGRLARAADLARSACARADRSARCEKPLSPRGECR